MRDATAHLTFFEDAAYSRLIRKYYAEERPLPADLAAVQRHALMDECFSHLGRHAATELMAVGVGLAVVELLEAVAPAEELPVGLALYCDHRHRIARKCPFQTS